MPIIDVSLLAGRSDEDLRRLIRALHEATVASLDVPPESVRVLVREVRPALWGINGQSVAERRARTEPPG